MQIKKLVISPHIDDEILGCGGILDKDTFVLYCGFDETHIKGEWVRKRPDTNTRLNELKKVQSLLKFQYDILYNKVNHYIEQDLIGSFEEGKLIPSFLSISVEISLLLLPKLKAARRLKKPITAASVQVAFSMVSVDCATPPN